MSTESTNNLLRKTPDAPHSSSRSEDREQMKITEFVTDAIESFPVISSPSKPEEIGTFGKNNHLGKTFSKPPESMESLESETKETTQNKKSIGEVAISNFPSSTSVEKNPFDTLGTFGRKTLERRASLSSMLSSPDLQRKRSSAPIPDFMSTQVVSTSDSNSMEEKKQVDFPSPSFETKEEELSLDEIIKQAEGALNKSPTVELAPVKKSKKSISDMIFGKKETFDTKGWSTSGPMLKNLEAFTKKRFSEGINDPSKITNLFLQEQVLALSGIPEKLNAAIKLKFDSAKFLTHFQDIRDITQFLKSFDKLKAKEQKIFLSFIGGKDMITALKHCTEKDTLQEWTNVVNGTLMVYDRKTGLPLKYDKEHPISRIYKQDIYDTFRSVYAKDFKEQVPIFFINGKWIRIPEKLLKDFNQMQDLEKKECLMAWLIGQLNTALGATSSISAEEQGKLLCEDALDTKESEILTKLLGLVMQKYGVNYVDVSSCIPLLLEKIALNFKEKPELYSDSFIEWAKINFEKLLGKRINADQLDEQVNQIIDLFAKNQTLEQSDRTKFTTLLKGLITQYGTGTFDISHEGISSLLKEFEITLKEQQVVYAKDFISWAQDNLQELLINQKETNVYSLITLFSKEYWFKKCINLIPCFRILQPISISAYSHADTFMRKSLCPAIMEPDKVVPRMKYFPTDQVSYKIDIDGQNKTFKVAHIRPYRFMKGDSVNTEDFGTAVVHWSMGGSIMSHLYSGSIWFEHIELVDSLPLKLRLEILKRLNALK